MDTMWNILKENDFQISTAAKSEIICIICKKIMIKPLIVSCGCRYCKDCLIRYLKGEEKFCLGESGYCKSELINIDTNAFVDQPANIKISRIVVRCPLESCTFNGELGKMADHMRTCNKHPITCPYYAIGCDKNKIDVDKIKHHLKQENYSHTVLLMDFVDNYRNEMILLQTNILNLQEENKCIKKQMESKQETILGLQKNVAELFQETKSLREPQTSKLNQTNQVEEILLGIQMTSEKQKEEMEKNKRKSDEMEINQEQMKAQIERITLENVSLRKEMEMMNLDNLAKKKIISELQMKSEEAEKEQGKVREKCGCLENNQEQMATKIDNILQENADMTTKSQEMENTMKILEANSNGNEFLWCIDNWNEKMKQAQNGTETKIFSNHFYSHKYGYKMCLRLDPDGYCIRKGTHLSLFFYIMRGEFDDVLQWPFRHSIKLDLINQETGLAHCSFIADSKSFLIDRSNCFKKPDNTKNSGYGFPTFIKLSELTSVAALLKDDLLWIKATPQLKP